MKGKNKL